MNNPRFKNMNISFHTGGDDKNPETRLEIFIVRVNGQPAVAYLDIHGQGYGNNSDVTPNPVPPVGTGFGLADLGIGNPDPNICENILVKITHDDGTSTSDTWIFNFNATLNFEDGTKVTFNSETVSLTIDGDNEHFWNLKTGTVARPSVV